MKKVIFFCLMSVMFSGCIVHHVVPHRVVTYDQPVSVSSYGYYYTPSVEHVHRHGASVVVERPVYLGKAAKHNHVHVHKYKKKVFKNYKHKHKVTKHKKYKKYKKHKKYRKK